MTVISKRTMNLRSYDLYVRKKFHRAILRAKVLGETRVKLPCPIGTGGTHGPVLVFFVEAPWSAAFCRSCGRPDKRLQRRPFGHPLRNRGGDCRSLAAGSQRAQAALVIASRSEGEYIARNTFRALFQN